MNTKYAKLIVRVLSYLVGWLKNVVERAAQ